MIHTFNIDHFRFGRSKEIVKAKCTTLNGSRSPKEALGKNLKQTSSGSQNILEAVAMVDPGYASRF